MVSVQIGEVDLAIDLPEQWVRAMMRAHERELRAFRISPRWWAVTSETKVTGNRVVIDEFGHIQNCMDASDAQCMGWAAGGRDRPCKHVGAVANAMVLEIAGKLPCSRDYMIKEVNDAR